MKSDYFYPHLGDRRSPTDWEENGARSVGDTARDRARELLSTHFPTHISDQMDRRLRDQFDIRLTRKQIGRAG